MGFFKKYLPAAYGALAGAAYSGGNPLAIAAGGYAGYQGGKSLFPGKQPSPGQPSAPASPFGIPLPGKTGFALGQDAADYYSKAFPGTNPWEQLGASNPSGAVETSQIAARQQERGLKNQRYMQERELNTRKDVAETQAKANRFQSILGTIGKGVTSIPSFAKMGPEVTKLKYGGSSTLTLINALKDVGISPTSALMKLIPTSLQPGTGKRELNLKVAPGKYDKKTGKYTPGYKQKGPTD